LGASVAALEQVGQQEALGIGVRRSLIAITVYDRGRMFWDYS
jgi:hypothetical protein